MSTLISSRSLFFAMALASAALMGIALYMEHVMLMDPCPLCMMQRIWVVIVGVLALGAALHGRAVRIWAPMVAGAALIGSGFSIRQLWLQSLPPDQVPACGPGLDYMLEVFPLSDVLRAMVLGTGNCAEVSWSFLGLTIPAWVLISFTGFVVGTVLAWRLAPGRPAAA
ncbi:MAG: disulfide bond formation protein B [Pseudomonadales bacterium]|jgi:disulfide bond formation protein DsbB|nr:disulfide bond formation protein B [Pseudomonadales bacterium]